MKKYIFTVLMTVATFVAANAQEFTVAEQIRSTCEVLKQSQRYVSVANQPSYYYDKDVLSLSFEGGENYTFTKKIRRTSTSGWALGAQAGGIKMAENFSPTAGLELTFAGKRFMAGAGFEAAISKYNAESDKSGHSFFAPIFSGKVGVILSRFSLGGYDNMGYIAAGYEFKYILDKNHNKNGEETYETATEYVTQSDYYAVEGNSMCHTGFIEARFGLKHMGVSSIGIKAYAGAYNRYYLEGSRRKAMIGASVSLYFSGAKKRVDNNVTLLQHQLEQYNRNINQMQANR